MTKKKMTDKEKIKSLKEEIKVLKYEAKDLNVALGLRRDLNNHAARLTAANNLQHAIGILQKDMEEIVGLVMPLKTEGSGKITELVSAICLRVRATTDALEIAKTSATANIN